MGEESEDEPPPKYFTTVVCFKCGDKGHISKECAKRLDICSIPSCQSQSHNVEGHKVMSRMGKVVLSGNREIRSIDTGPAKKATDISNKALAQKQQKNKKKNRKRSEKGKLATSLLTQLANASRQAQLSP